MAPHSLAQRWLANGAVALSLGAIFVALQAAVTWLTSERIVFADTVIAVSLAFVAPHLIESWRDIISALLGPPAATKALKEATNQGDADVATDALTGLLTRAALVERLERDFTRAAETQVVFTLLRIELDDFAHLRRHHGRKTAEEAARAVGRVLRACARDDDVVACPGAPAFSVVLSRATAQGALIFAERLRRQVSDLRVATPHASCAITISIGIAEYEPTDRTPDAIAERAEAALRQAIAAGCNCTIAAA